jgi:hypothetical protein
MAEIIKIDTEDIIFPDKLLFIYDYKFFDLARCN